MEIDVPRSPELKAELPPEAMVTHEDMLRAFQAFRDANDARLAALERRAADPLDDDKIARIGAALDRHEKRLDELVLKAQRPPLAAAPAPAVAEHKAAFAAYVRRGDASGLGALEAKAMSAASDPDGGYLVPAEVEDAIGRRLAALSPIRALATVREISASAYKKPFMTAGPAVGWVGEADARPQTATPTLAELAFPAMELYAMPAATATLLDDAVVDIDAWLAAEVEQAFAEQEGQAFVSGDGVARPKGFLAVPTVANAAWTWGNIGHVATGTAGAFPATDPSDVLIDLVYALKPGYRQNASFVMNRRTQGQVRKFKDTTGNYLWAPPATADGRASLMGFPLVDAEDMPDVAANSPSIAFGDFRRGYLVVDRQGVRVLRDPYSAKPYVLFYTTKRVGGGVQDFDAIKLLKFAA